MKMKNWPTQNAVYDSFLHEQDQLVTVFQTEAKSCVNPMSNLKMLKEEPKDGLRKKLN